jgi:magnesium-transporting ATPase (P-type)
MSVIVEQASDKHVIAYIKGSPEKIKDLSVKNSIPDDYDNIF